jgi:hypothetical protein
MRASAEMAPCPILLWSSLVVSIHGVSVAVAGHRQGASPLLRLDAACGDPLAGLSLFAPCPAEDGWGRTMEP